MGYRVLNFFNLRFYCGFIWFHWKFFTLVSELQTKTKLLSLGELMHYYCTNRMNVAFRFVFLQFLLPCLINASLSVCVWVFTISIVSSLNKVMASVMWRVSSTQIDCPNNSHTHTHVCVWIASTDLWYNGSSMRVWVWRRNSWSFFSFVFACMCLRRARCCFRVSLLCVCLPWRVICIAINGCHTQQFGFFRNQENK